MIVEANKEVIASMCISFFIFAFIIGFILILCTQLQKINYRKQYGYKGIGTKVKIKGDIIGNTENNINTTIDGERALKWFKKG